MMSRCIPFVSQMSDRETTKWIEALRAVLLGYEVMTLADCSTQQYTDAQIAIVANPDAADFKKLPNLQWVQSLWAGVEQLLLETQLNNVAIKNSASTPPIAQLRGWCKPGECSEHPCVCCFVAATFDTIVLLR
ncbi:MAG: hypothetical protein WBG63_19085 [Phormidesmis sp.]